MKDYVNDTCHEEKLGIIVTNPTNVPIYNNHREDGRGPCEQVR